MIEMVYSGKETDELEEVRIPKNIRQIGDNKSKRKIYVEDYVMTNLKKKPDIEDGIKYGVLLGDIKRSKGNTYVFIRGMVETREIIENSIIFNDDTWATIYKDIKNYFQDLEIVGWFVSVPYTVKNEMSSIQKIHLDNFAGNDKVCYLSDRTEHEDGFFSFEDGMLKKQLGYYIFYEKNEKMKKYLRQTQGNRSVAVKAEEEKTSSKIKEKISDNRQPVKADNTGKPEQKEIRKENRKQEKNKQTVSNDKVSDVEKAKQHLSFREMLKKQMDEENGKGFKSGRVAYGISSLLIIALLLSTAVMLNNYGELRKLKKSIETMGKEDSAEAVNQILSSIMPTTAPGEAATSEDATSDAKNKDDLSKNSKNDVDGKKTTDENNKSKKDNAAKDVKTENTGSQKTENHNNTGNTTDNKHQNIEKNDDSDSDGPDGENENESVGVEPRAGSSNQNQAANIYGGMYHTIKAGQTLYDISMTYYGNSNMVERIKEYNNIDDDYLIKEGEQIRLP